MTDFFNRIKKWIGITPEPAESRPAEILKNYLIAVQHTHEVEYDCDEVYNLMDQYTEMVNSGEDAAQLMPLVKQHLEMCHCCLEEYEALLRILEKSSAEDPI